MDPEFAGANTYRSDGQVVHPWVARGRDEIRFGVLGREGSDWAQFRDWVQLIETLGFDSFWLGDHPMIVPRDCWSYLAALATVTKRIRLGSLVSCVYYRSPALLARVAADVDRLSNGRLVLGLGIGDYPPEFEQMGLSFGSLHERQQALEDSIEILRGLWSGQPFSYQGDHFRVTNARIQHGPIQEPYVPLLIAGGGERVTLRQVARYADASNFGPSNHTGDAWNAQDVAQKYRVLRQHCEAIGRPYESVLRSHILLRITLRETDKAVDTALQAASKPGYGLETDHIAGTPRDMIAYYRALVFAGVQYFIVAVEAGDTETVRLLARDVLPEVQHR